MKKKILIALCSIGAVICLLSIALFVYLGQEFPGDETVARLVQMAKQEYNPVEIIEMGGPIQVQPAHESLKKVTDADGNSVNVKTGKRLIFYPGARVKPEAYIPLMYALAENGVYCYIECMPWNLAMFQKDAAEGTLFGYQLDPDYCDIYLAGHSMGASAASGYIKDNADKYDGFIMMGSYAGADLTETGLKVLTIHGSEDGLMAKKAGKDPLEGLPDDAVEVVIQGGCHAYVGNYGPQSMDGTPTITREEQQAQTVKAILEFMGL